MFNTAYDPFLFADRADVAPSLDYYIDQFPTTYTRSEVVLRDNSIYYARGTGAPGEIHYVRIHVRFGPGTYPNRTVIISLSVQKVPSLQFASSGGGGGRLNACPLRRLPVVRKEPWARVLLEYHTVRWARKGPPPFSRDIHERHRFAPSSSPATANSAWRGAFCCFSSS